MPIGNTIVALSTPMGESAIALVRLSGPDCAQLAQDAFGLPTQPPARTVQVGSYNDLQNNEIDHCVYLYFHNGASYTGEPMLEIHCHGNPLIVQKIIEDLIHRGCRMAEAGEFTRTAFENGKLDLAQAEAVVDVIHARSVRSLRAAQKQLSGALGRRISQFTESMLNMIAQAEVYIDFPEDDLPDEDKEIPIKYAQMLIDELSQLIRTQHYSALLHEGINTIILGAPNAGKSSLLNALTGQDRAIVSEIPGTTRDFISEKIMIEPYCINIIDTAGIHETSDRIESLGIKKTVEKAQHADLYIVVIDSTEPYPQFPEIIKNKLTPTNTIILLNKIDLQKSKYEKIQFNNYPTKHISLKTGENCDELPGFIKQVLEADKILPNNDDLILNARHATALEKVKKSIEISQKRMQDGVFDEITAGELRIGLDSLGEVVGKIDNERILDKLFETFCIGK